MSAELRLSERMACKLLNVERSSYRYEPRPDRSLDLRGELVKLARPKLRYGYRRLHALLSRRREACVQALCGREGDGATEEAQATGARARNQTSVGASQPGVGDGLHHGWAGDRTHGAS